VQAYLVLYGANDSSGGSPTPDGLGLSCTNLINFTGCDSGYLGSFKHNLQQVLNAANAVGKSVYLGKTSPHLLNTTRDALIAQYNQVVDELVSENGSGYVPANFHSYFTAHPDEFDADGLHPAGIGYVSMGRLWCQTLDGQLGQACAPPPVETPVIEPAAGIYSPDVTVSISAIPEATIYYTTDGTDPIPLDPAQEYLGPFALTAGSTTIKAIAVQESYSASSVASAVYQIDQDGDGHPDSIDNCVLIPNPDQLDTDSDGAGDACDNDNDNDGLSNDDETLLGTDPLLVDTDGDGLDDYAEVIVLGTDPLISNRGDLAPHGAPNGTVDLGDYVVLSRLVTGVLIATPTEELLGDLNDNGDLDTGDLILLMRVVQGLIPVP